MKDKKILEMEDLMVDFDSLDYRQMQDLQKITGSEYDNQPIPFKYGKFDLVDLFHSFISQKD